MTNADKWQERRTRAQRIAGALGRPMMLVNNINGRYGGGLPHLFAERALTKLEAMAQDHAPQPGVWWQSPVDAAGYLEGNGRQLSQDETDLLIVSELYKTGTRADLELLEQLWGPPIVFRDRDKRSSHDITARQQRGGVHSDPLIRIAAVRAFGLRDFQWGTKCEEPSCEWTRGHKGWHGFTFWVHCGQSPRRYNAPALFDGGDDDWLEGFRKEYSSDPRESSFVHPLFTRLGDHARVITGQGTISLIAGENISRGALLTIDPRGRAVIRRDSSKEPIGIARHVASHGEAIEVSMQGSTFPLTQRRRSFDEIRAELEQRDAQNLEPVVLNAEELRVAMSSMGATEWGLDRDARGVCVVCRARASMWCDRIEHEQQRAKRAAVEAVAKTKHVLPPPSTNLHGIDRSILDTNGDTLTEVLPLDDRINARQPGLNRQRKRGEKKPRY